MNDQTVDLLHADARGRVADLAMQVGCLDDVVVDDAKDAYAGAGEVLSCGTAEAAGADYEDFGGEEVELACGVLVSDRGLWGLGVVGCGCVRVTLLAHSGDDHLAGISVELIVCESSIVAICDGMVGCMVGSMSRSFCLGGDVPHIFISGVDTEVRGCILQIFRGV